MFEVEGLEKSENVTFGKTKGRVSNNLEKSGFINLPFGGRTGQHRAHAKPSQPAYTSRCTYPVSNDLRIIFMFITCVRI